MKIIAPDYYPKFKCIADRCKHSCCIGWEIDIDNTTLSKYNDLDGDFGERVRSSISFCDDTASFTLTDTERCPFLNSDGLCEMILNLGEDALCQICTDHPRFRNFYSGFTEIGLGMCCEEAARLIITSKEKTNLIAIENSDIEYELTDNENSLINLRNYIFDIVQDRSIRLEARIDKLIDSLNIAAKVKAPNIWLDVFKNLEYMDSSLLNKIKESVITKENKNNSISKETEIEFEQILVYFLYRHLSRGLYDGKFIERISFSILSVNIIKSIFLSLANGTVDDLIEICRLYSCEIEYSEENVENLLDKLQTA